MTEKRVLTIQDISCIGQCSMTVALPIISACGVETIVLPSALLSSHTGGFSGYTFHDLSDEIPKIRRHWEKEGLKFDCIYTGYLGSVKQIEYVKDLMDTVLKENAIKIIDPAMADNGKLYAGFQEEYVHSMALLCKRADIILPNITEAAFMTGLEYKAENQSKEYIEEVLQALGRLCSGKIILKGLTYQEGKLGVAVYDSISEETEFYFTERIPRSFHGTGDCFASAFTGAMMQGNTAIEAVRIAAEFVLQSIQITCKDDNHWYGVRFEQALPFLIHEVNEKS